MISESKVLTQGENKMKHAMKKTKPRKTKRRGPAKRRG